MVETVRLRMSPADPEGARDVLARVAEIWARGGTVAFPTETVYGLGAHALDGAAVERIFVAKQRPHWDPLIVHVTDETMLARVVANIPKRAQALIKAFWPGPLTLLLPRSEAVPDAVTAGRLLVGVRMPAHPVAHALIARAGLPIAAPSANSFGRTSPTTAFHVLEDLDGRIDAVVDGGPTHHGLESTVVDASGAELVLYRPGVIQQAELERVAGPVAVYRQPEPDAKPDALPSPGVGIRHYAPRARLVLVEWEESLAEQNAKFWIAGQHCISEGETIGLMLPDVFARRESSVAADRLRVFRWGRWEDLEELGRRLFLGLRELDASGVETIVCPLPADRGVGTAIRDRLRKAAMPPVAPTRR